MDEIERFWTAFYDAFQLVTQEGSCGCHVHIKPINSGFDMARLKQIAYAVIIYEKHVLEILRAARRTLGYCEPNTEVSPQLKDISRTEGMHSRMRS